MGIGRSVACQVKRLRRNLKMTTDWNEHGSVSRAKSIGEYQATYLPKHPRCDMYGRVATHILVAEYHIRHIKTSGPYKEREIVHHRDMDRGNNHPGNLHLMTRRHHDLLHHQWREAIKATGSVD